MGNKWLFRITKCFTSVRSQHFINVSSHSILLIIKDKTVKSILFVFGGVEERKITSLTDFMHSVLHKSNDYYNSNCLSR